MFGKKQNRGQLQYVFGYGSYPSATFPVVQQFSILKNDILMVPMGTVLGGQYFGI